MWFQIELPEAVSLTEIQFESPGGFRAPPPQPPPAAATTGARATAAPAAPAAPVFPAVIAAFPRE